MTRDYVQDILHKCCWLPDTTHLVYSSNKSLIFIEITKLNKTNKKPWIDYHGAYRDVALFLNEPDNTILQMVFPYRNVLLCHVQDTWWNHFKIRKIYRGKLPEYKS